MTRRVVVGLTVALGVVGCSLPVPPPPSRLESHYRMQRPHGPGPFAAVLLIPGCEGVVPARLETAAQLVRRGYIVVFVDYVAARGLATACGGEVGPGDVGRDIRAVSAHLRRLADVRSGAIGAIGWALGGSGLLASLVGTEFDRVPPVDAAVAFYPFCRGLYPWKTYVPTLVLLAGQDDIAPPAYCEDVAVRSVGRVQVHVFPDAGHAFDMLHAEAAREAWSEALTHLEVRLP